LINRPETPYRGVSAVLIKQRSRPLSDTDDSTMSCACASARSAPPMILTSPDLVIDVAELVWKPIAD
jgi:hypothetical protein